MARPPDSPQARLSPLAASDDAGTSDRRSWREVYADGATVLGWGLLPGLVCGALIGGVGGRLAMFALRLTSDDTLHGLDTDDGFTIGAFTAATIFLVAATDVLGAAGGLLYMVVREWLPARGRPALFGLLGATAGGALVIRPDGIDFTLLDPLWLAVALFVLLPAAYGVSVSVIAERLVRSTGWRRSRWRWLAALPLGLLAVTGPLGLGVLLLIGLIVGAGRSDRVGRLWRSDPVTWLGRGVVAVALGTSSLLLVRDIVAVL